MPAVFADTGYWIAVINPNDSLHPIAQKVSRGLGSRRIVTSDMILVEVLDAFAERGPYLRQAAADAIESIVANAGVDVVPQTRKLFGDAFALYRVRPDKGWSLTDCASCVIMKHRGIAEVLTHDHHFTQMGYRVLL
jgi:predicted nucleic acid-binding protein